MLVRKVRSSATPTTLKAFGALVFRPLKGPWNWLSLGLPGVLALLLWGLHHGLAAWIIASATLIVLLAVAGYRLQGRVLAQGDRLGFLDSLGYQLTFGRLLLDSIEPDQEKLTDALEQWTPQIPAERQKLDDLVAELARDTTEWRDEVAQMLDRRLGYSSAALFLSNAGLTPAVPPATLTYSGFQNRWREHEMRLQRLHRIIEDLTRKWAE
jgi:hypothetical protein